MRERHIASESREDASPDGISWITAGESVARLVHDQTQDVAKVISPEFEAELVKKVQCQQADLSRHGAADRQLAHEICFNIDDKMLPYLLGADLSSGCAILRVLHKEILASTAEHTAALHERFAKPVTCRDKTKLLLTLRQCKVVSEAVSAQAAMTPAPSSSSKATPPGLSVPVSNSANSESVTALAAVLEMCCLQSDLPILQSGEVCGTRQICWVRSSTEIPCVRCT